MKKQMQQDEIQQAEVDQTDQTDMWKEKYLRALADYQNLQKRTVQECQQVQLFAGVGIVEKFLPVVDLLEKAQEHLQDQGLELALKELRACFDSIGVKKIDVMGKVFDPYLMDCIELVEGGKENTVASVISSGYTMHGKLIRPAKVIVGADGKKEGKKEGV